MQKGVMLLTPFLRSCTFLALIFLILFKPSSHFIFEWGRSGSKDAGLLLSYIAFIQSVITTLIPDVILCMLAPPTLLRYEQRVS